MRNSKNSTAFSSLAFKCLKSNTQDFNYEIEGLRGLAIITIVIYHIVCRFNSIYLNHEIGFMHDWGALGVAVFLLISSYYLPKVFSSNANTYPKFSFRKYLTNKFLRLWPCYFICISITFIILQLVRLPGRNCTFLDYILNIFFINGYIGTPYVDGAHWYLTVLLSMILIFGLFRKLRIENKWYIYIIWLILGGMLKFLTILCPNNIIFLGLFNFICNRYIGIICVGISLKYLNGLRKTMKSNDKKLLIWLFVLFSALLYNFVFRGINFSIKFLFILLIFVLSINNKLFILKNRALLYLGTISYPLYLIHQNIAYVMELYWIELNGKMGICGYTIVLFLVLFLGSFLYCAIEMPVQCFRRRICK